MVDKGSSSSMALNLKKPEVEAPAEEVAQLDGTSKAEAIRQVLLETDLSCS
jgi:hypothetical protein